MSKDILYQPKIGYKKNYYTEGKFESQSSNQSTNQESNIDTGKLVTALQNKIESNSKWIPQRVLDTYMAPYLVMKDTYNNLTANNNDEDNHTPEIIKGNNSSSNEVPDDMFKKGDDIYVEIKDPLAEYNKVINQKFYIDFIDVYMDYLEKLNTATSNYVINTLANFGLTDYEFLESYSSKDINNDNLKHISDYLTKSDIVLDQTLRLHEKLYDYDSIILHVRNIKLTASYIERYYGEDRLDNNNSLNMTSNILLEESKRVANKKYEENFLALYKYLNSNVILMDESLKILSKQNKCMITINKNEER